LCDLKKRIGIGSLSQWPKRETWWRLSVKAIRSP
jgi:hypothetical protein